MNLYGICMKKNVEKHRDQAYFFATSGNVPKHTFLDTKCLKFHNKNVSTLSNIFLFL